MKEIVIEWQGRRLKTVSDSPGTSCFGCALQNEPCVEPANQVLEAGGGYCVEGWVFHAVTDEIAARPDAPAIDAKSSNPKEAIGDTKVPLALLSPIAKAHWASAQFLGQVKYGGWNWRAAGVRVSTYLSALGRHLDGYMSGETFDPTDGTHHLGNVMACAAILLDAEAAGKLTDDRPPSVDHRAAYAHVEALMATLREKYADRDPRHYTIADTEKKD